MSVEPDPPSIGRLTQLLARSARLSPLALANGVSMANSFVIAVLYSRLGGPESYGVYQMALAAMTVAGILGLAGAGTAAMRAAAQGRSAAWPLFRARLPYCFAAAALLGVVALSLGFAARTNLAGAIAAAAVTLPAFVGGDVFPAHLIGQRRYGAYLRYQIALQTVTALGVVLALLVAPHDPWVAVLAFAGTTGGLQLVALRRLRTRSSPHVSEDVAYARRYTGIAALGTVDVRLDVLLTGSLLGAREAGIVAVARLFPRFGRQVWDLLVQPFFVKMAGVSRADALAVVRTYRIPLVLTLGGLSAVGIVAAPFLIPLFFGSEFSDAVTLTQLLLLANAIPAVSLLDELLFKAQGDLRPVTVIRVILLVASLVALPPLVIVFGIVGVGVKALLTTFVYVILVALLTRRRGTTGSAREPAYEIVTPE